MSYPPRAPGNPQGARDTQRPDFRHDRSNPLFLCGKFFKMKHAGSPRKGCTALPWKPCGVYWIELTAEIPRHAADAVGSMLFEHGASSVQELDAKKDRARLCAHLLWSPEAEAKVADIRKALRAIRQVSLGTCRLKTRQIEFTPPASVDGSAVSWCFQVPMKVVVPDRIGNRVVVKDPADPYTPGPGEVVVELVPSRAFGNGAHNTTRMCCRALESYLQPGDQVADIGTGTGLLAIAAVRMGAGRVIGFDIENEAVEACRRNMIHNNAEGVATVLHADQLEGTARRMAGRFDVVVANLLPWVLQDIAPNVKRMLRAGGLFIMSGLRPDAVKSLDFAIMHLGFDVVDVSLDDEWCCLVYRSVNPPATPVPAHVAEANA